MNNQIETLKQLVVKFSTKKITDLIIDFRSVKVEYKDQKMVKSNDYDILKLIQFFNLNKGDLVYFTKSLAKNDNTIYIEKDSVILAKFNSATYELTFK